MREIFLKEKECLARKKRRKVWMQVFGGLACLVAACTIYALILPAAALEKTTCGMEEHVHSIECYQKAVPEEDAEQAAKTQGTENEAGTEAETVSGTETEAEAAGVHIHTDECYKTEQGELICEEEESEGHIHTEDCYETERGELICEEEESEGHTHTDDCYGEDGELICEEEESEGHTHTDECYEQIKKTVCGQEESEGHQHTDECYEQKKVLICEEEEGVPEDSENPENPAETAGTADEDTEENKEENNSEELTCGQEESEEHQHTELCYGQWELICGLPEHTHTDECYESPDETENEPEDEGQDADEETREDWEKTMEHVALTGNFRQDVIAIAQSQLGYEESKENVITTEEEEIKGYSRYGAWYGDPYGDWSAMFVSFCLHYAQVEGIPLEKDCEKWIDALSEEECGLFAEADGYTPVPGDIIFVAGEDSEEADHTGLVEEILPEDKELPARVKVIEGDSGDQVQYVEYELTDSKILGYGLLPEQQEEDAENPVIQMPSAFTYENDYVSVTFHVTGTAVPMSEETQAETSAAEESVQGKAAAVEESVQDEDAAVEEPVQDEDAAVKESVQDEGAVAEESVQGEDAAGERKPEEPELVVTELSEEDAEYQELIAYTQESSGEDALFHLSAMRIGFSYQGAPLDLSACEIEAEVSPKNSMLDGLEPSPDILEEAASEAEMGVVVAVLQNTEEETEELDSALLDTDEDEIPVFMVALNSSDPVLAVSAAQTANPKFKVQYYAALDVVATTGENALDIIDTSGKKLPQNGSKPTTKNIYLTSSGNNGKYKVATTEELKEVYAPHEYEYITAPNLTYFNRLYENGNYSLKEVWVLKTGKNSESTARGDWDVYNPQTVHFTNRATSAGTNTVLIQDKTVIRLVFETTKSPYTNAVNFYDYDITNDGKHTYQQGINSAANYSGSGSKLAFGNANTGTGLQNIEWNGNELNKSNVAGGGYKNCTFGLVTGLQDGKVQYAGGVIAPKLFDEGGAIGKTSYDNGQYSLNFNRDGDTYTLTAVDGAGLTGLEYFNHPTCGPATYTHIWTNNFWPMDSVKGKDGHTGAYGSRGKFIDNNGKETDYPLSDDGKAHNNMFGMQYAVQFELTEDYSGPLEYYFFGDDDMWVFLDGKLVCDIGGVHSSVGEYVNLWDYVSKGSSGKHTLSFFYTERGLSGSSCYMQFTLPSVSSVTPEQNTGMLTIQKQVEGPNAENNTEEFQFDIQLTDANGRKLPDDYSYSRYAKDGSLIKQDVIIFDGGSFELKNGEYVVIKYLPYGTKYTITEKSSGYIVSNTVDSGEVNLSVEANGSIAQGKNGTVVYTNKIQYELPETGGSGALPYTLGGIVLMAGAVVYGTNRRKKRDR